MNDYESDSSPHPQVETKSCHPERNHADCHPERSEGPAVSAASAPEQDPPSETRSLAQLRRFTPARIALGRAGDSLPTAELLDFSAAHAMARDAVHAALDTRGIAAQLTAVGLESVYVHSAAQDRATYLRRPDLGRRLDEASRERLSSLRRAARFDLLFIIADGLSAIAPERYAVAVIEATRKLLGDWEIAPILIAEQARVALGDEAGEMLDAAMVVTLIGERPGLSSPESLGIYLTYAPRAGRTDAERNCISNVREEGMSPERAAQILSHLLVNARRLKLSGVGLKDTSDIDKLMLLGDVDPSAQRHSSPLESGSG